MFDEILVKAVSLFMTTFYNVDKVNIINIFKFRQKVRVIDNKG